MPGRARGSRVKTRKRIALTRLRVTNMKVSSHTSPYRGVIVTIEKHKDHDGRVSLYATIDGQVFCPIGTDSFNSILKECRAQIDRRIDEQKCSETKLK